MINAQHSEICLCVIGNLKSGGDSIRKLASTFMFAVAIVLVFVAIV